ncbi:hypothetical protein [Niabella ginsenosidivorans]|uniref:hypothetical protein n=1 Tax=Niabella ginsenosidivorans TaxID=1176587 RepID=UPI000AA6E8F3|nr:hypothetical protein [Niabella ginsenosidivorans]
MSNKVITMHQVRSILQYLIKGFSLRAVSRELRMSRKTVTQYTRQFKSHTASLQQLQHLSDAELAGIVYAPVKPPVEDTRRAEFEAQTDYFFAELSRTGVTRLLLWQEYRSKFPNGYGYTQFCILLSRQKHVDTPTMRFDYRPAEVVMIDFAGDPLYYTERSTGELITCPVLVCVLPYSGYSFVKALPNATLVQLMGALGDCLSFFGGVPRELKTDNMRQIVVKPSAMNQPLQKLLPSGHNTII